MIDFRKKLSTNRIDRKIDPIELYNTLDRKSVAGPLRPAQEELLRDWYNNRRNEKDLIIKLHTGEGKTLIGLLILQSMINQKEGPCLYICPNIYLVEQVADEAKKFGIPYCVIGEDKQIPDEFLSGEKILITHAHKVFNGKSVFGIDNNYIPIGAVVLDDAHACADIIKDAFTISLSKTKNEDLYKKILTVFSDDLSEQGEGSFMDIQQGNYETFMAVPYWSWNDKRTEILKILSSYAQEEDIQYVWPLMRDRIKEYSCYISGHKIEISPYNANVDVFGSFCNAKHRILMSATTQNDSFFVKGLSFSVDAIRRPLMNTRHKWSGEKMILLPSLINENCDKDFIVSSFAKLKQDKFGIVALVPSLKRAEYYQRFGATIADRLNIVDQINCLKKGEFNSLLVLVNRFDGVDLPDESCRILIIDSMPFFDNLSERYERKCRPNSETINKKMAQKIEQGLGRGVRGEKDYCAILIIGTDIVKFMRSTITNKYFSAQTRKQIEIGLEIAKMAQEEQTEDSSSISSVISLIKQMLNRDEGWKEYYNEEMNTLEGEIGEQNIYDQLIEEQKMEKLFSIGEYEKACCQMQNFIDHLPNEDLEKGWFLQQLARYTYQVSKEKSILIQKSAFNKNSQLLKPLDGVVYKKVSYIHENRMNRIRDFLREYTSYTELMLSINETLENLSFGMEADKFEAALQKVGMLLGYISQRPDKEIRKGPDNLWCCNNNEFLLFECKNEVEEARAEITKYEAGQMNSHCAWFEEEYGATTTVARFMIIPTKELSYYANFTHEVRIIRRGKLKEFKSNIKKFIQELRVYDLQDISEETLERLICLHRLNYSDFIEHYSEDFYHQKNKN